MTYDKAVEITPFGTFESCCNAPDIIEYDGNYVCQNCGLVHSQVFLLNEKRMFSPEDVDAKKQNEPAPRIGSRTYISGYQVVDYKGNSIGTTEKIKYNKLSKINNSYSSNYERNLTIAIPRLKDFCTRLDLSSAITEDVLYYYSKAVKMKLTMGKSIECLICACIYLTTRLRKLPRSLEEISEECGIPTKNIRRTYRMLLKHLDIKNLKPVDHTQYILKFGAELEITVEVQNRAVELIRNAKNDQTIKLAGKDPKGFAAAALYIASKEVKKSKSQSVLANIAHISEVTLRYRIRNLKKEM